MELYKQKRKLITITCDYCGKEFSKPESEYKRNVKLGRHNFCSRSNSPELRHAIYSSVPCER